MGAQSTPYGTFPVKLAFRLQEDTGFCNATVLKDLTAEKLLLSYTVSPKRNLLIETLVKEDDDLEADGASEKKPDREEVKKEVLEESKGKLSELGEEAEPSDDVNVDEPEEGLWKELFGEKEEKPKPVLRRLRREAWHRTIESLARQYAGSDTIKIVLCQSSGKLEQIYTGADKMGGK